MYSEKGLYAVRIAEETRRQCVEKGIIPDSLKAMSEENIREIVA